MMMPMIRRSIPLLAVASLLAPAARAAIVVEAEANGTAVNNTLATAQAISASAFTLPVPATVFNPPGLSTATVNGLGGVNDVDFFSFTTQGGATLFDIDDNPFTFDTILSLFNSSGTLIAFNDDSFTDAGSQSQLDSFIGTINLAAGTYYIAVSQFSNFASALSGTGLTFTDLVRPDGQFGGTLVTGAAVGNSSFGASGVQAGPGYTLHISTAAVPEPSSLAMCGVASLAGLGGWWRRRRKAVA